MSTAARSRIGFAFLALASAAFVALAVLTPTFASTLPPRDPVSVVAIVVGVAIGASRDRGPAYGARATAGTIAVIAALIAGRVLAVTLWPATLNPAQELVTAAVVVMVAAFALAFVILPKSASASANARKRALYAAAVASVGVVGGLVVGGQGLLLAAICAVPLVVSLVVAYQLRDVRTAAQGA